MCGGDVDAWWWYGGDYLHLCNRVRLVPQHLSRGQHLRNNIQGLFQSAQGRHFLASLK